MRYITKTILIFLMTQSCTFASDSHFQPFGSTANSIATFTMTGGIATSLTSITTRTYTTTNCSGSETATYVWSSGSWPVNTAPRFGFTKSAAYLAASSSGNATSVRSIRINFTSPTGISNFGSGNTTYCIQNVSCTNTPNLCTASPTPTGITFTMN